MKSKGPGTKVTTAEKRRYDMLREAGFSVEAAAESIGRSKSWGYLYEGEKRGSLRKEREPVPSKDLREAVDLILAIKHGDEERSFAIYDRFGTAIVPHLAEAAWHLADVMATGDNGFFGSLFKGTPLEDVLARDPLTPEEYLETIPRVRADRSAWVELHPDRVLGWLEEIVTYRPELEDAADRPGLVKSAVGTANAEPVAMRAV